MPENSRGFATFAEEPSGGGEEKEPYRGPFSDESVALDAHWKAFGKIATGVAVVTFPLFFLILNYGFGMGAIASVITAAIGVAAFRGFVDVVTRHFIPSPSLFTDDGTNRERDIVDRRRTAFWRSVYRFVRWILVGYVLWVAAILVKQAFTHETSLSNALTTPWNAIADVFAGQDIASALINGVLTTLVIMVFTVVTFFGPLMIAGIRQIKAYEPGDADWGVRIDDVRGQRSAREAVRRLVTLWQSGEEFEASGGKRERGLLMIGPPGTGKTMMAKALGTRFNCPVITVPGSAFAQSFIGVDVMIVMWMTWRARRLSRKWGGQAIVFIDEIDVIGGARSGVMASTRTALPTEAHGFYGPMGALNSSHDLILETQEWRDRLFEQRAANARLRHRPPNRFIESVRHLIAPGMNGGGIGQAGFQQLLVEMDGMRGPTSIRRFLTNRINTVLDASFVVPAKIGQLSLRLRPARPRKEDVFFVGACNVERSELDPALTRPGRMGYTVHFGSPDISARADILDLYVNRIAHEPELATTKRLNELARITMGYSPAMIEQAMSLALANAHFDNRTSASWTDTVRALTVVGYGDARDLTYTDDERRSIAIHEAGHAVTGHVYKADWKSSRLSIVPRGASHGHHAMAQAEPRYLGFSKHHVADLIWGLGAIAAEYIFYNDTSAGVGGDLDHVTAEAASMVGLSGMRATMPDISAYVTDPASIPAQEKALRERFATIGRRLMNRSYTASILGGPSLAAILEDELKLEEAAVLIGQAFMNAYWLILHNKEATQTVAETVLAAKEIYGDEIVDLLDSLNITIPDIDPTDESNWPRI